MAKRIIKKVLPPQTITYSPEIEGRRAKYQKLAEALITMLRFHVHEAVDVLDIVPPGWCAPEPESYILYGSIEEHFRALFENLLVCYKDDFLRVLYVELRLYYDEQMLSYKAGAFSYKKDGKR